jgi:flagellar motor switch protein FliN/FliY
MTTRSENSPLKNAGSNKGKADGASGAASGQPIISADSPIFKDARVVLKATLGQAELSVQDILGLRAGSVVELDTKLNDLVELRLNGSSIARCEIVAVEDCFAVRIVEIAQL